MSRKLEPPEQQHFGIASATDFNLPAITVTGPPGDSKKRS
jgi:hypothetical protein